ncbi:hypothetical protein MLD38_025463 [Melastoma candidum]|uniref:Uncharacterized protein n=1 Tax=Melastoma candidum TaxID=119954 RepID=A0ACB9P0M7_9MYRT|nr:hypothetical protein MLD38_025463 [Melastoma candidum]
MDRSLPSIPLTGKVWNTTCVSLVQIRSEKSLPSPPRRNIAGGVGAQNDRPTHSRHGTDRRLTCLPKG